MRNFDGLDREHLHADVISSDTGIIFTNANSEQIDSYITIPHDNWLLFPVLEAFPTFDYN